MTERTVTATDRESWIWGPLSALGFTVAALVVVLDQANKA